MATCVKRLKQVCKGCLAAFFLSCLLSMLLVLRSVEIVSSRDFARHKPEPGYSESNGNSLIKFQVFPRGGDEVPKKPNWTLPEVSVETDADEFLGSPDRYIATNFSFSPGLGNNMFQYASLLGIARRSNASLLLPDSGLIRRSFAPKSAIVISPEVLGNLSAAWSDTRVVYPDCCRFYESSLNLNQSKNFVMGYLQSWKYFHPDLEEEIRREFAFLPEIVRRAETATMALLKGVERNASAPLIGVHVRQGMDIAWNVRNQAHGHAVAPLPYLLKAREHFRDRFPGATFVVASDNIYWAKRHLVAPDTHFLNSGTREVDLCALTRTSHVIMSTGTFSWWAAYLAGGEAVYYDQWPRRGSQMARMLRPQDYFLPHWVPLN